MKMNTLEHLSPQPERGCQPSVSWGREAGAGRGRRVGPASCCTSSRGRYCWCCSPSCSNNVITSQLFGNSHPKFPKFILIDIKSSCERVKWMLFFFNFCTSWPVEGLQQRPHESGEHEVLPVLHGAGRHVGVKQTLQPALLLPRSPSCGPCKVKYKSLTLQPAWLKI